MSSTINLHDKLTNDLRTYPFEEGWTIRDLRESIADEEGYDSAKPIKIFNAIFELNDDELVQDFAGEEEENFIEFNTFSTITSNKDILIWRPSIIGSSWFPWPAIAFRWPLMGFEMVFQCFCNVFLMFFLLDFDYFFH